MNTFGYVLGNPVSMIDPLGLHHFHDTYDRPPSRVNHPFVRQYRQYASSNFSRISGAIGDGLTVATPFTGPFAPKVGTAATVFTGLSMLTAPSQSDAINGAASLTINKAADVLLRKVQGPLELTESVIQGAKGVAGTPQALKNIAENIAGENERVMHCPAPN